MKKIGYLVTFVMIIVIVIPIIIIGGIGPGIKFSITPQIQSVIERAIPKTTKISKVDYINVFIKDKIVKMKLEDYITGVVAAEMPVKFNIEALKAQAVTARTYAVAKMLVLGGKGCVRHKGADVCSEIHCQAYLSKEERLKSWKQTEAEANWAKISSAVKATEGQIICYNNKIADGVKYFSTSNGRTENSINVFGYKAPYLISVSSSNEEEAPNYKSSIIMSKINFVAILNKIDKGMDKFSTNALKVKSVDMTDGGRVNRIKIGQYEFSGQQIRQAYNLKSTDFSLTFDKNNAHFEVKGYGHGVGLSQWGANEMGKRGSNYISIVKHYFTGTKLENINNVFSNKSI